MKSCFHCFVFLLAFIVQLQLSTAYPPSYAQRQRGYLLCQLSAVSCKRSLPNTNELEEPSEMNFDQYLPMCLALNKPLRLCLDQALNGKRELY